MAISESTLQDVLTFDSLLDPPVEPTEIALIDEDDLFTEPVVEALLPTTAVEEPEVNGLIEDAIAELEVTLVQGSDSVFDTDLLVGINQSELGTLAATTNASLSGLYDDPIEYGNPFADAQYWRLQNGNTCAVVAQISVYQSLTGQYISEYDASVFAQQQGWFNPATGTPQQYVGHILDYLGVPTYEMSGASLATLEYALAYGDKPIVGLDANEIWTPLRDWYGNPVEQADGGHAVWVTGIDYEWNGSIGIVVNDSGHPNGMASVIDYADFMNAWQDYNYFVSIADNPYT